MHDISPRDTIQVVTTTALILLLVVVSIWERYQIDQHRKLEATTRTLQRQLHEINIALRERGE